MMMAIGSRLILCRECEKETPTRYIWCSRTVLKFCAECGLARGGQ